MRELVLLALLPLSTAWFLLDIREPLGLFEHFPFGIVQPDDTTGDCPAEIPSEFCHLGAPALFGPQSWVRPIQGDLVYATPGDLNGCSPLNKSVPGTNWPWSGRAIVMVDRGNCTFVTKVRHAQRAGAAAVIIVDNVEEFEEPWMADDGTGSDIRIPAFLIHKSDGQFFKDFISHGDVGDMLYEVDFPGMSYNVFNVSGDDWHTCQDACNNDTRCTCWTFRMNFEEGTTCALKTGHPAPRNDWGAISGVKNISDWQGGTSYLGSYRDYLPPSYIRVMPFQVNGTNHTVETCRAACPLSKYQFIGVENRGECHCSNTWPTIIQLGQAPDCSPLGGVSCIAVYGPEKINVALSRDPPPFPEPAPLLDFDGSWNFTLIARDLKGDGGSLRLLSKRFGTSWDASFNLGPLLMDAESYEFALSYGTSWDSSKSIRFRTKLDLFSDAVDLKIPITDVNATDPALQTLLGSTASFCLGATERSSLADKPGGTVWGVTPSDNARECGCSGNNWAGRGIYYGGFFANESTRCTGSGGGFSGPKGEGEVKGGINDYGMALWVDLNDMAEGLGDNIAFMGYPFGSGSADGECSYTGPGNGQDSLDVVWANGRYCIKNINDGWTGDYSAWQPNAIAYNGQWFVGVSFSQPVLVRGVGISRDNTGDQTDHVSGGKRIQYSLVFNPSFNSSADVWHDVFPTDVETGVFRSVFPFELALGVTGIRVVLRNPTDVIDELEIYGSYTPAPTPTPPKEDKGATLWLTMEGTLDNATIDAVKRAIWHDSDGANSTITTSFSKGTTLFTVSIRPWSAKAPVTSSTAAIKISAATVSPSSALAATGIRTINVRWETVGEGDKGRNRPLFAAFVVVFLIILAGGLGFLCFRMFRAKKATTLQAYRPLDAGDERGEPLMYAAPVPAPTDAKPEKPESYL